MNKKKFISTIAILSVTAALIPILVFSVNAGMPTHILEAEVSLEEVIDRSSWIVQGEIIKSDGEKSHSHGGEDRAFTVWRVEIDEVFKDITDDYEKDDDIYFKTVGGELSDSTQTGVSVPLYVGDEVIVMLIVDEDSIYEDDYYLTSYLQGVYVIQSDGTAKSIEENNNKNEVNLISIIKNHLN